MTSPRVDVTEALNDADRARLDELTVEQSYAVDEAILSEGTSRPGLIRIVTGTVSILKMDQSGIPQLITRLDAPAVVGDLELVTGEPCNATVRARTAVTARILHADIFDRLLEEHDPVAITLLRNLARVIGLKLAASNEAYVDMAIWR